MFGEEVTEIFALTWRNPPAQRFKHTVMMLNGGRIKRGISLEATLLGFNVVGSVREITKHGTARYRHNLGNDPARPRIRLLFSRLPRYGQTTRFTDV